MPLWKNFFSVSMIVDSALETKTNTSLSKQCLKKLKNQKVLPFVLSFSSPFCWRKREKKSIIVAQNITLFGNIWLVVRQRKSYKYVYEIEYNTKTKTKTFGEVRTWKRDREKRINLFFFFLRESRYMFSSDFDWWIQLIGTYLPKKKNSCCVGENF